MLDKYIWGDVSRISPEAPVQVVNALKETYAPGGASNVASNVSSLGANVSLYGILSKDLYSEEIKRLCQEKNISLKYFQINRPTIVKERTIAHRQQVVRKDYGEINLEKITLSLQDQILDSLKSEIGDYHLVILSDYDKHLFCDPLTNKIISLANSNNIPTLVDPKPINFDLFTGCRIICPNKKEAEKMSGIKYQNGNSVLMQIGSTLSQRSGAEYVIITCGEEGVFSYHEGDSLFIPTIAKQIADETGAGDTFAATLGLGFVSNLKIHDAVRLANYAAGIVVEKVGTATTTTEEILAYLNSEQ